MNLEQKSNPRDRTLIGRKPPTRGLRSSTTPTSPTCVTALPSPIMTESQNATQHVPRRKGRVRSKLHQLKDFVTGGSGRISDTATTTVNLPRVRLASEGPQAQAVHSAITSRAGSTGDVTAGSRAQIESSSEAVGAQAEDYVCKARPEIESDPSLFRHKALDPRRGEADAVAKAAVEEEQNVPVGDPAAEHEPGVAQEAKALQASGHRVEKALGTANKVLGVLQTTLKEVEPLANLVPVPGLGLAISGLRKAIQAVQVREVNFLRLA